MSDQVIKDTVGRAIGFIRTTLDGRRQLAYSAERQYQGYYDAQNDLTKDRSGATVAKGNVVSTLIFGRR